jgi:prepilin-type processing-associated H-X9-DG protein
MTQPPKAIDVDRAAGVTITWADGHVSRYPVDYLRRMSPSADAKALREEMGRNPLAVLPGGGRAGALTIQDVQLRGNYALWVRFSDGHATGVYSWEYLREIDPGKPGGA